MGKIHFLQNEDYWSTIRQRMKAAKHVAAAIAYLGKDGARLLPFKKGDRLVVDMSPEAVKAGTTNPYEVEKLIRKGVQVFSRRNLHAKVVVADTAVIIGSANISHYSETQLDEAGLYAEDKLLASQCADFITRIATEPVRKEYLSQCKSDYKPPTIKPTTGRSGKKSMRASHAKLWLVNLIDYMNIPEWESNKLEESTDKARNELADKGRSNVSSFHWSYRPKMADQLTPGDWVIQCITHKDKTTSVYCPGQFLWMDNYVRDRKKGKRRYLFHLEVPRNGQTMSWSVFRKVARKLTSDKWNSPRTRPVSNSMAADDILRLWTPAGRIAKR